MSRVLVVAPHPDDETLGPGGTLLAHATAGHEVHWCIVTEMVPEAGYGPERIAAREEEIAAVGRAYGFASVTRLGLPAAGLDAVPRSDLVRAAAETYADVEPVTVYLPHVGDAHTDHQHTFEAFLGAAKSFRAPWLRHVLIYETLSETDANPAPTRRFTPTSFVDVTSHLTEKLRILAIYAGETGPHPFPRSEEAVRALATLRGAQSGLHAAEAFMLLWERRTPR